MKKLSAIDELKVTFRRAGELDAVEHFLALMDDVGGVSADKAATHYAVIRDTMAQVKTLVNPNRPGGVSRFELEKAAVLLSKLETT